MRSRVLVSILILGMALGILLSAPAAWAKVAQSKGQTIYIPAYKHVYDNPFAPGKSIPLATTLLIHNVDPATAIEIISARHYDYQGKLVREYMPKPLVLPPFAAEDIIVKDRIKSPGSGTSFVLTWRAKKNVVPPIVECLMVTGGSQGISFRSTGIVIKEAK